MKKPAAVIFQFPEVRVVEASAGSGKTYALAKRYVQLLLNPALRDDLPLRHILAITFTNKAAFEMKARVMDFLKKMALGKMSPVEEREILKPVGLNTVEAGQAASRLMSELIHHYDFFQVQTIDSFINALVTGCAFKVGLSAGFKIKRNSRDYLTYSLDELVERAGREPAVRAVFDRFLTQYIFLENKPSWFPKKDVLELLVELFSRGNTFGAEFEPFALGGEDLVEQKRQVLERMRALRASMPDGIDARFVTKFDEFLEKYQQGFDVDRVSDYFAREEIPARKGVAVSSETTRLWSRIRQDLRAVCELEAYSLFNPYIAIYEQAKTILSAKVAEDDVLFLEELNRKAGMLFDAGAVTVEEVYYRLATRFHHYLVDEFQDTSILQWRNIFPLAEEALASGGSLFYVGDKKQAIYGFRGGEVRLFDEIPAQLKDYNIQKEQLVNNYRSRQAIVEFNNAVFSVDNLQRFVTAKDELAKGKDKEDVVHFAPEDFQAISEVFGHSRQAFRPEQAGGYVKVERVDTDNKEARNEVVRERMLAILADLKPRVPLSGIAVLTRSNDEIEEVTSWLLDAGYPVESERTMNIRSHPLVQELLAFLQFLNSPIDNLAFAHFIVGDIFCCAAGIKPEAMHAFLFSLRDRPKEKHASYVYKEFRDAFPDAWQQLFAEFFRNVGLYPLYELSVSIAHRFSVLANFPQSQGFVLRFLEIIKKREEETSDLATFLAAWENLPEDEFYVNVADSAAIKVLTVHKAKGLEFPVVILPFLSMKVQVGSGAGLGQLSYLTDTRGARLRLLRIKGKYLKFSATLADIWQQEYFKAFLSELNNVYVALTRPAEELYIFIPKKTGSSYNLASLLVPDDFVELGSPSKNIPVKAAKHKAEHRVLSAPSFRDWVEFLKEEFPLGKDVGRRPAAVRGEILHYLLSLVGNIQGVDIVSLVPTIIKQAQPQYPQVADWESYSRVVTNILATPALQPYFAVADGEVRQEQDVVNSLGHTRRVDRLIIKPRELWVVDYKSSREPTGAYHQQLREYMSLLAAIHPTKTVKGYLIYLDDGGVDEVGEAIE